MSEAEEEMREISEWIDRACSNYEAAKLLCHDGFYSESAFLCQQSIEKALKACYIKENGELIKTHSVKWLAKEVGLSDDLSLKVESLEGVERLSRYPVDDEVVRYDRESVEEFLNIVREVIEWIKNKMLL